jgi:hypothetical protein
MTWPAFGPLLAGINTRYGINGQKKLSRTLPTFIEEPLGN